MRGASGEAIDMATSRIAVDLAREGILQPFDLSSLSKSSAVAAEFAHSHRQLQVPRRIQQRGN
jgi:hypothetical protein